MPDELPSLDEVAAEIDLLMASWTAQLGDGPTIDFRLPNEASYEQLLVAWGLCSHTYRLGQAAVHLLRVAAPSARRRRWTGGSSMQRVERQNVGCRRSRRNDDDEAFGLEVFA